MAHGNGPGAGSDRVSPPAGGVGEIRSTRRELLRGSLGAAILLAGGRAFAGTTGARAAPGALGPYFVFGTPNPSTADDPSLIAGAATTTAPLAHRLVTPPLRSRDRSRLALVSVEDVGGSAGVIATVVDTRSGAVAASGTLRLADALKRAEASEERSLADRSDTRHVVESRFHRPLAPHGAVIRDGEAMGLIADALDEEEAL